MNKLSSKNGFTPTRFAQAKGCGGFTLVEMMVAISVLLIAIVGPLTIASQALFSSNIARDRLTAAYLAQEGVELVRAKRDTAKLQGTDWIAGLSDCLGGNSCRIGPNSFQTAVCPQEGCPMLELNISVSSYGYAINGDPSGFVRNIWIEEIAVGHEARVTSEVVWQAGGKIQNVTLVHHILNWQ